MLELAQCARRFPAKIEGLGLPGPVRPAEQVKAEWRKATIGAYRPAQVNAAPERGLGLGAEGEESYSATLKSHVSPCR
jgi:hypothetical protein